MLKDVLIRSVLWSAIIGGLLLPPLSINGFPLLGFEYLAIAGICILTGVLFGIGTKFRIVNGALMFFMLVLFSSIYLASPLLWTNHPWIPYAIAATTGLVTYAAIALPRETLSIIAAGAMMYTITSVALTPTLITTLINNTQKTKQVDNSKFPVLHVLLDEHIGIAAIPNEIMSEAEKYAFIKPYLDRGFLVFTHAHTADMETRLSVSRFFNSSIQDPQQVLRPNNERTGGWDITQADTLHTIATKYDLNLYFIEMLNVAPALQDIKTNISLKTHNLIYIGDISSRTKLSLANRMLISASVALRWLNTDFKSPLILVIKEHYPLLNSFFANASPPTRRDYLDSSLLATSKLPNSNWYTFIHSLMTHIPYVFNEDCVPNPLSIWGKKQRGKSLKNYSLHIKQAKCATKTFLQGLERFKQRPDFEKMTIIVHGDHGSRIHLKDVITLANAPNQQLRLNAFSTFLAIRLPDSKQGQVINTPVRLDDVFSQLVQNDFKNLDIAKLPKRETPFEY